MNECQGILLTSNWPKKSKLIKWTAFENYELKEG